MPFFKKKTEKTVHTDIIDEAYIDKLLSGDRKPVKPAKKPLPHKKLLILAGGIGLALVLSLIGMMIAISVGRRTDPDFGFRDLFVPTTTQQTTQEETQKATLSTPPATTPTVKPTELTEPPLCFDEVTKGEITYLVPNKTLDLSLRQYYCTCPTLPIPGPDGTYEEWIQLFYSLLAEEDSWYHQALTSHYATPQEINMEYLLSRGIAQGGSSLESYPEAQWLLEHSFLPGRNVIRLPASDIMSLESVYFGTAFEDHESLWYPYNRENACFYYYESEGYDTAVLGIVDFEWQEDGNVCVCYAAEGWDEPVLMQVVLRPVGDYFQIVSNLPVPKDPVTIDLEDIPNVSGSVYEPGSMFVEPGYSGNAKWGESNEFSIELPLLEPFCEGAKAINAEIKSIYQSIIDDVKQNILYQTSSRYWKVSYKTYLSGDVLSIVISEHTMSDSVFYQVFNLDLTTGQQLDQYEMIRRYTGMTYPEFLLRANYTVANHLCKEYPQESEEVTNWLSGLETDAQILDGHKLFLNDAGTLILLNYKVRSMAAGFVNVQIPFDPEACGEAFSDWELESYRWVFGIPADGAYAYEKGSVLEKTFFFDPERFLRYLSGSEYWLTNTARLLASELHPENAPLLRDLCKQYLGRSDTAKAAQEILNQLEKYADYY